MSYPISVYCTRWHHFALLMAPESPHQDLFGTPCLALQEMPLAITFAPKLMIAKDMPSCLYRHTPEAQSSDGGTPSATSSAARSSAS
jgi:hypothetical protein